ncbi:MAG TPA: hypothetical protein ENH82_14660 [bacterium]|nr:hypothetical protein [bacterium]
MRERGNFYHDTYEAYFFMNGEKNLIKLHLDFMDFRLLMSNYGLNPTETIYKYVAESLQIEAFKEGLKTEVHRFAFYNDALFTLYFYNDGNQIYRITSDSVNLVDNGTDGVLFLKDAVTEPFLVHKPEDDLSLFDDYIISKMHFDKEILNEAEYKIVLSLWFYSLFFGSIMRTKPILALIGPKKSGKTSALAKIGVLLMGENFEVTPLSSDEKDFDAAITNQYFVAIDNADSAIKWFNNKLAIAATGGSIKKRELHTTNKLVEFPIKSYLAITSNSPKFRRDDVAERLLILKLERINKVISENKLRENILKNRENILSEIIYHHLPEIIKALKENPVSFDVGSFRMADFADFSLRVARYANIESTVKKILSKLSKQQSHFTLEYDTTFELLLEWLKKNHNREVRSVELHHELSDLASEKQIDFFYKDKCRAFAQHLRNIISNLSEFIKVEERMASGRKRLYRFAQKDDGENNV